MSPESDTSSRADYEKLIHKWSRFDFSEVLGNQLRELADPVKDQFFGAFDYVAAHTRDSNILGEMPDLGHTADTLIFLTTTCFLVGLEFGTLSRLTGAVGNPLREFPEVMTYLEYGREPAERIIVKSVGRCVVVGMPMDYAKRLAGLMTKALLHLAVESFKVGYRFT